MIFKKSSVGGVSYENAFEGQLKNDYIELKSKGPVTTVDKKQKIFRPKIVFYLIIFKKDF